MGMSGRSCGTLPSFPRIEPGLQPWRQAPEFSSQLRSGGLLPCQCTHKYRGVSDVSAADPDEVPKWLPVAYAASEHKRLLGRLIPGSTRSSSPSRRLGIEPC